MDAGARRPRNFLFLSGYGGPAYFNIMKMTSSGTAPASAELRLPQGSTGENNDSVSV
jgi:hypothetical protein